MLRVAAFLGGFDQNFSYLVWCPDTRNAALIDAATPVGPVTGAIQERDLRLGRVLLTHTHGDHLAYLEEWLAWEPRLELAGHQQPVQNRLPNYHRLQDGDKLELGRCRLVMMETPGHYPDCVCWYHAEGDMLFTGDTIFVGRTGRTIDSLSNITQLYHSVYERILTLPPETTIYPGHDYGPAPTATLGELRSAWDFFQCASETQFRAVMARFEETRKLGD